MRKNRLAWCLEQKQGVRLIEPNKNMMKDYLVKARNALEMMRKAKDNLEWRITTGYYAMYFSAYALLMRVGIKSELHICTIQVLKEFFKRFFVAEELKMLEKARGSRIATLYYVARESEMNKHAKNVLLAEDFYLRCKHIAMIINKEDIDNLRASLIKRMNNVLKEKHSRTSQSH